MLFKEPTSGMAFVSMSTVHKVNYKDCDFILAYDKLRKSIATFLPADSEKNVGQPNVEFWK